MYKCRDCGGVQMSDYEPKNSDNGWFTKAENLDGSPDSSYESSCTAPINSAPKREVINESDTASSKGGVYIKPVKGVKDNPTASIRREPEPSYPSASSTISTTSTKEEHRCLKCGAVVPEGVTLCLKCSVSERIPDKAGVEKTKSDIISFAKNNKKPVIIGVACVAVVILLLIVFGNMHKLSGKYSYTENGYKTTASFKTDGTVSLSFSNDGNNYSTIDGHYYWNSNEHRYYLEFPGQNWWGGSTAYVITAEPIFGGLRLMADGETVELKRGG